MEILEIPNLDSWSEWSCSITCGSGDQTRTRNCVRGACTDIDSSSTYQRGRCYPGDCPQCHVSAHCDRRSTDDDAKICHQHICESCENLRSALACQERFRYNIQIFSISSYFFMNLIKNRHFTNEEAFNDCIARCANDQNQGSTLFGFIPNN